MWNMSILIAYFTIFDKRLPSWISRWPPNGGKYKNSPDRGKGDGKNWYQVVWYWLGPYVCFLKVIKIIPENAYGLQSQRD